MSQRNKKCEARSYDLRGAKRRHVRGPDSREGRFTSVAPGAWASTRNQWTGSVLSRTLLLLGVRGRFLRPVVRIAAEQQSQWRFLFLRQSHDRLSRLFRITGLLTVVVALKPGGGSNSRVVVGISFAQFGGTAGEVRAEATRSTMVTLMPSGATSRDNTSEKPSTPHFAAE